MAIIGLMAALAGTSFVYGTRKARANNAVFEVAAAASAAQARAVSSGVPQYLVYYAVGTERGYMALQRPDPAPDWGTTTLTPDQGAVAAALAGPGGRVFEAVDFERGVDFMPLLPPPLPALVGGLPAPFSAIDVRSSGTGPLLQGCSFCLSTGGGALGAVRFNPDGTARIATAVRPAGGVLAIGNAAGTNSGSSLKVIAFATPGGLTRIYK